MMTEELITDVTMGNEKFSVTPSFCEDELRGRWTIFGCVVNSTSPPKECEDKVCIYPIRVKKYPVAVNPKNFQDITTDGGKYQNMHTFLICS